MFSDYVVYNPFVEFAVELGVTGGHVVDNSFASTYTALFYPRDKAIGITTRINYKPDNEEMARLFIIKSSGEDPNSYWNSEHHGDKLVPVDDVNKFLEQRGIRAKVFIGETKDIALIDMTPVTAESVHLIQALTPRLFPKVFESKPINEVEMKLLTALSKNDGYVLYNEAIDEIAKAYDFRRMKIDKDLTGFEVAFEEIKISHKRDEISNIKQRINNLLNEIGSYRRDLRNKETELIGLQSITEEQEQNRVRDFFRANTNLELRWVEDANVCYCVKGYATFWNVDTAEQFINNDRSLFYDNEYGSKVKSKLDRKILLNALFVDKKVKLRMITSFILRTNDRLDLQITNDYPDLGSYMKNPHIGGYGCLGDAVDVIHECLMNGNYVGGITQSIFASKQLSLSDQTVMRRMTEWLFDEKNTRFIELPDGTCVTPVKAIQWLKEQEGTNE